MFDAESASAKSQMQKTVRHVQESPERESCGQTEECEKGRGDRCACRSQQESGKTELWISSLVLDSMQREI